jgi:hypothetical protein
VATIASLAVQITANPTGLLKTFGVVENAVRKLGRSGLNPGVWAGMANRSIGKLSGAINGVVGPIKTLVGSIPLVGGSLASIPTSAAGVAEWFKEGSARINEMRINSQKLGVDIEKMAGLMLAAGPASESISMSMLRLQKELGEAAMKAEGTEVVFGRLGLNAKDLTQIPLDSALGQIADRINLLNNQADKGAAVFSIFGKRGAEMMPMLARGSAGLESFQRKAREMGLAVNSVDAENVRKASIAIKQIDFWVKAAKQSVATELAPVVLALTEQFGKAGYSAKEFGQDVKKTGMLVAYAGAYSADAWGALGKTWDMILIGFKVMGAGIHAEIIRLVQVAAMLPESLGGNQFAAVAENMRASWAEQWQGLLADKRKFLEDWNKPGAVDKLDNFFRDLENSLEKQRVAMKKGDDAGAAFTKLFELFERGQKITQEFQSPLEKFDARIKELDELVMAGAISWQIYERAVYGAAKSIMDLSKVQQERMSGAAEFGSQEAYSIINKNMLAGKGNQSGLDQLKDAIRLQTEIQKRQQRDLDDIAWEARRGFLAVGKL